MRRYDLDWLRVLVFGLLIFYHVGMFFVPWEFHIKNNVIHNNIRIPMLFLNQWRLPILFVISGMGTYYALSRRSGARFAGERITRLLVPLIVGMILVVPPQVYFERLAKGEFSGSYLDFWPVLAFNGPYPEGNLSWHHLWFLIYLLSYSLILIPVFLYLRRNPGNCFLVWLKKTVAKPLGIYLFILPLFLIEVFLRPYFPVTHAFIDDWYTFFNYFTLFFYGFLLISIKDNFWKTVQNNRRRHLWCGIIGFASYLTIIFLFRSEGAFVFLLGALKVFNCWSWILTIFGYAATYLNRNSGVLAYSNEAVYPFYILHQTITIAIGYYIMDLDWGFWSKFSLMVTGTFGITYLLYEFLIRRVTLLRPLFGLKLKPKKHTVAESAAEAPA